MGYGSPPNSGYIYTLEDFNRWLQQGGVDANGNNQIDPDEWYAQKGIAPPTTSGVPNVTPPASTIPDPNIDTGDGAVTNSDVIAGDAGSIIDQVDPTGTLGDLLGTPSWQGGLGTGAQDQGQLGGPPWYGVLFPDITKILQDYLGTLSGPMVTTPDGGVMVDVGSMNPDDQQQLVDDLLNSDSSTGANIGDLNPIGDEGSGSIGVLNPLPPGGGAGPITETPGDTTYPDENNPLGPGNPSVTAPPPASGGSGPVTETPSGPLYPDENDPIGVLDPIGDEGTDPIGVLNPIPGDTIYDTPTQGGSGGDSQGGGTQGGDAGGNAGNGSGGVVTNPDGSGTPTNGGGGSSNGGIDWNDILGGIFGGGNNDTGDDMSQLPIDLGGSGGSGGAGGTGWIGDLLNNFDFADMLNQTINVGLSDYAANKYEDALGNQLDFNQGIYDENVSRLNPYNQLGMNNIDTAQWHARNLPQLDPTRATQTAINPNVNVAAPTQGAQAQANTVDVNQVDVTQMTDNPFYQAMLNEANRNVTNSATASGRLKSGGTDAALAQVAASMYGQMMPQFQQIQSAQDQASLASDAQRFQQGRANQTDDFTQRLQNQMFTADQGQQNVRNRLLGNDQLFNQAYANNNQTLNRDQQIFNQLYQLVSGGQGAAAGQGSQGSSLMYANAGPMSEMANTQGYQGMNYARTLAELFGAV